MPKTDLVYIREMLDLVHEVNSFISGYTAITFLDDPKTIKAVAINIQFLGETANQLSNQLANAYPEIPWRKIIGLRHKIVHHYMEIDPEILWDITQKDLPPLKDQLLSILQDLQAQKDTGSQE